MESPGMGMCLMGNGDVPHRESTSSPGMHILTGNAHSLYRVNLLPAKFLRFDTLKLKSTPVRSNIKCTTEEEFSKMNYVWTTNELTFDILILIFGCHLAEI